MYNKTLYPLYSHTHMCIYIELYVCMTVCTYPPLEPQPANPVVPREPGGDFPFCTARCPFLVACLTLVATPLLLILLWPGLAPRLANGAGKRGETADLHFFQRATSYISNFSEYIYIHIMHYIYSTYAYILYLHIIIFLFYNIYISLSLKTSAKHRPFGRVSKSDHGIGG